MYRIENTLISEEIFSEKFVCDLKSCKGACCVEGYGGAPLEKKETELLEKDITRIKPFLSEKGKKSLREKGVFFKTSEGELETPLVENKECAYSVLSSDGSLKCGIEKAYDNGKINWKKPISCHLYPIRIKKYKDFTAMNYHQWSICSSACKLGESLKVPVFRFLKEALERKFGKEWYLKLQEIYKKNYLGKK
ncbi:MAG: hypothetical protein CMC91_07535 [Flavobacteriaceae bacterium]|nr:hypothetical protein [Flavobacteriaceae bacterium]|tara:strand:+ start:48 stop:626 length:579 start_codon:yes stop_codon:yes gene_type:complete